MNILLKNEWVNQKIKEEKKYMEANKNDNMMVQNLWNAAKVVIRGKQIAIHAYIRKQKKSHTQHGLTIKDPEKEQQMEPTASRRGWIINIRAEINDIKTNKKNRTDQ